MNSDRTLFFVAMFLAVFGPQVTNRWLLVAYYGTLAISTVIVSVSWAMEAIRDRREYEAIRNRRDHERENR